MENGILIAVLVVIVGLAVRYVYKAKKNGETCIGCPHSRMCRSKRCDCGKRED